MAIFDIFNVSFLFSIGIIVILIGGIFTYVSYRMSEQDHKLSSMLGLVVSLANDLQQVKDTNRPVKQEENMDIQYASDMMGGQSINNIINVSDGGYDDEDDNEEYDDLEGEETEDDLEVEDLEGEDLEGDDLEGDDLEVEDLEGEDLEGEDLQNLNVENLDYEELEPRKIKVLKLDLVNDGEPDSHDLEELDLDAEPKSDAVVEFETEDIDNSIEDAIGTDYKKMSTNKLREVVVCKGLIPNATKLKKNELLKLLGDK
jgi:hypothetical protein